MRTALLALPALLAALSLSAQPQPPPTQAQEGRVAALAREGHSRPDTETWKRHAELLGKPAPALELDTWVNGRVGPEDMKGRIVVIDFWATWRRPCIDAVPRNNAAAKKYADKGVLWVGVCGSGQGEDLMTVVVGDAGIAYPVCYHGLGTAEAWRVEYWPTYGVIDRNGILRALGIDRDYVEQIIDALLEEDAAPWREPPTEKAASGGNAQASAGSGPTASAASAAGYGPRRAKSAFGLRSSLTIPQDAQIYNNIGPAVGYGAFGEWMVAEKMAISCTAEYLNFSGVEWSNGVKTGASALRLGADLALRPQGIERGFFAFAGLGFVSAEQTAAVGRIAVSADGSGAFFSYGAGFDFSSVGIELRFINVSLEFKGLGETDDFSSVQIATRFRFALW
jgi:thiol-disulfide isomerase/thioredoxin